jgi:hypothetical protein
MTRLLSWIALLLTAAVMLVGLPACGSDDDDGGGSGGGNAPAETTEEESETTE